MICGVRRHGSETPQPRQDHSILLTGGAWPDEWPACVCSCLALRRHGSGTPAVMCNDVVLPCATAHR
eukprot:15452589-Alexandrium_andersonii.AAC.1